uniref:Uncharacterized protein n=1 Tax=Gouania willdenowi TaxID=441366 RepID=A0A8C5I7Y9_GOUWI
MAFYCSVLFLAVMALAAASDPNCENLTKTVEDEKTLYGKWLLYAATADCDKNLQELKTINSSWIELSPLGDGKDMVLRYGDNWRGSCEFGTVNATNDGNVTRATFHYNSTSHEHVGRHIATCPDSVLWTDFSTTDDNTLCRSLYLFTKTGKLDDSHQEYFKKQLECLNFKSELLIWENPVYCQDGM